jgi:hypothetical protein
MRRLFESPHGRLDADPPRTKKLVQLVSQDSQRASGMVLGQLAALDPPADRLRMERATPADSDTE